MQPNEHLPQQFWLTNQDGTYYQFLATLDYHDPKTAVLLVESVKSEALCKGMGKAEPRPQNRKPYAKLELRADGSMHARFGRNIALANETDRDGYLYFQDVEAVVNHVRLMQWVYKLWGELLPDARIHLSRFAP